MASEPGSPALAWRDALTACTVFVTGLFLQISSSFAAEDEAWFIQVVRRVLNGEVLFRDVAFGINPLSVYLVAPIAWLFGSELLVVKVVQSLVFAATALMVIRIGRKLGLRGIAAETAVVAGFVAMAPPGATISLYTPLSMLFLLGALAETLEWLDGDSCGRLNRVVRGGLWVGAAFMAKQNLGVFAFVAMAIVILFLRPAVERASRTARWQDLGRLSAAAAIVAGVVLVPVLTTGSLRSYVDYAYLGKSTYLQVAGVDPLLTLEDWSHGLANCRSVAQVRVFLSMQAAILPVIAFGGLACLSPVWWRTDRRRTLAILGFALAGYAAVFPRADMAHVAGAVPVLLVALVHAVALAQLRVPRRVAVAVGAAIVVAALAVAASRVATGVVHCVFPEYRISELPGLRGVLAPNGYLDDIGRDAADLDQLLDGRGAVFLLSPRSGMFSLIGGRANPTPFDYPFVTTLGKAGEDGLIAMLDSGRIRSVCVDTSGSQFGALWPARFEAEVRRRFRRVDAAGKWVLYSGADGQSP